MGFSEPAAVNGGRDVVVRGDHAFVGSMSGTDALVVYDVEDPSDPTYLAKMETDLEAARGVVEIGGGHLLVSGRDSGSVVAVDVAKPANPEPTSSIVDHDLTGARGLWYGGEGYAYLAVGYLWGDHENEALAVFDVADPTAIEEVDYLAGPDIDRGGSVLGVGEYLFVSGYREDSIMVFDRSDPASPTLVERFTSPMLDGTRDLSAAGGTMYATVAAGDGMAVLDCSDPPALELLGHVTDDALAGARGNDVHGDFVYVASREANGVATVDVSDPTDPVVVDAHTRPSLEEAYGLTIHDERIYVPSAGVGALTIFGDR
jgi:hypothetical protein